MQVSLSPKSTQLRMEVLRTNGHDMSSWSRPSKKPKPPWHANRHSCDTSRARASASWRINRLARQGANREELTAALAELGLAETLPVALCSTRQRPTSPKLIASSRPRCQHSPRLLVERGRHHASKDGAHAEGLGKALAENGDDERVVCLDRHLRFNHHRRLYAGKPERADRG